MVAESCRIYHWSPVLVRDKLYFVGIKEGAECATDLWRTSKVLGRMGSRRVVTMSGKVYMLVGKPVVLGELRDIVPVWVEQKFQLGLPRNWEKVVKQWAWVRRVETERQVVNTGRSGVSEEFELEDNPCINLSSSVTPSPMKLVNGILHNYSCIYCSIIPRPKSICRSELYRHYSIRHFTKQLGEQFGKVGQFCLDCKRDIRTSNWITHMGQVHGKVEMYLPIQARLPGGRRRP